MKRKGTLWQISLTVGREAEDGAAALLERLFGQTASVYAPEESNLSVATAYSTQKSQVIQSKREALQTGLKHLADCDLEVGPVQILIQKVPQEDWATSWKKYFKTIEIGRALLIRPSWSKRKGHPGQAVVTLDPGLSFGTGQHPTTSFCLEQLVRSRKSGQSQSFLDIGTGSGILSIAAVKLGYAPVHAFDNDAMSVRVANANARKNRIQHKLCVLRKDLTRLPMHSRLLYDVICANLVQDLLLTEADQIVNRLGSGGILVLAGLLTSQFAQVEERFIRAGLHPQAVRAEGEWKSGAFLLPK